MLTHEFQRRLPGNTLREGVKFQDGTSYSFPLFCRQYIDWVCATIFGATKAALYYTTLVLRGVTKLKKTYRLVGAKCII